MEEARKLLAEALRVPLERITDETAMRDLPPWDSLGHMELIALVEERFGATLSMDDILAMTSVRGLAAVVQRMKGAA